VTDAAARRAPDVGTLALLSTLYFVQGLPYGFQDTALPAFLSKLGLSYSAIGFASALSLPWLLKPLWAPVLDRYWHAGFGRRKTWIVPLQLLLACACVAAAFSEPRVALARLMFLVLVMNVLTATQDIAVDGYAVDRLSRDDLGYGNSAQVVGYKIGMLVGGGLLWSWYAQLQWRGIFFAMAGFCLFGMGVLLTQTERPVDTDGGEKLSWRQLAGRVRDVMRVPGAGWLVALIATYKMGETLASRMFVPWLGKSGLEPDVVASLMGTWVMVASLCGSLFGGVLSSRMTLLRAVVLAAALRVIGLAAQWLLVVGFLPLTHTTAVGVASVEHFFSGALTVCMFALMMSRVDRKIGATHYTVLAAIEVAGKAGPGLLSGVLADAIGVGNVFLVAVVMSVGFFALVGPVRESAA
jgi:MFS family permease